MKSVRLSIPEPCHENWQQMTLTEQGRFCKACAKQVIDFSMMSDQEVFNYFSRLTDEKICGRALPAQLNRQISIPREPKKKLFWYWNYIAMFFMFFSKSNHVKAQNQLTVKTEQKAIYKTGKVEVAEAQQIMKGHSFSGKVTSITGRPVSFANIKVIGTEIRSIADISGDYIITVNDGAVLQFSAAGFESVRVPVNINLTTENVVLKEAIQLTETIGGAFSWVSGNSCINTQPNQVFEIKVIDKISNIPVNKASLLINKIGNSKPDTSFTDKAGVYKIKKIKGGDTYKVTVSAAGYEDQGFIIEGSRVDPRKIAKEIYLTKKTAYKRVNEVIVMAVDVRRSTTALSYTTARIDTNNTIQPAKTTKQETTIGATVKGAQIKQVQPAENKSIIKTVARKITDSLSFTKPNAINLYPNPVRRGSTFLVSLSFQQTGSLVFQITDLTGRVVLQKQVITTNKDQVEKIEMDSRWPAGVYFLSVFSNNGGEAGKLMRKVSFVVQ